MITGRLIYDDETLILIGLTERNLSDLKAGLPIALRPDQSPIASADKPGILLFSSETEESLIGRLRDAGVDIGTIVDARQSGRT